MTMLLGSLKARGLPAFINFLRVLKETFQGWIADDIYDSNISGGNGAQVEMNRAVSVKELIGQLFEDNLSQKISEEVKKAVNEDRKKSQQPLPVQYHMPSYVPPVSYNYASVDPMLHYSQPLIYYSGPSVIPVQRPRKQKHNRREMSYPEHTNYRGAYAEIAYAPSQLRSLQQAFDRESSSTNQSISLLKQEELTIRERLKQNVHEQQELVSKQLTLSEIEEKMKQITEGTSKLLHTESADDLSREKRVERIPWR